jgi:hypothetical protein
MYLSVLSKTAKPIFQYIHIEIDTSKISQSYHMPVWFWPLRINDMARACTYFYVTSYVLYICTWYRHAFLSVSENHGNEKQFWLLGLCSLFGYVILYSYSFNTIYWSPEARQIHCTCSTYIFKSDKQMWERDLIKISM